MGVGPAESAAANTENWKLLKFFNYYRLAIALSAAAIGLSGLSLPPLASASAELFRIAGVAYAVIALVAFETIRRRRLDFQSQATLLGFADIALLTLLMHASGGLGSGMGLLLLVAVAGTSLMLSKRFTIFFAALATVAALLEHASGLLASAGPIESEIFEGFPQVGMLGIGLFATAILAHTLAARLRVTEELANRRGADVANLAQMNALIIDRMQSGVLACDLDGSVRFINHAAQKFLGAARPNKPRAPLLLSQIAPDLAIQLRLWSATYAQRGRKIFTTRTGYTLLPRFVGIGANKDAGAVIFLDDMGALKQQAQQLKMTALARLTASIAHEIRNPLGAISNAAQLLAETCPQDQEERRLVKIIEEQSRRMNAIVQNVTQLSRRDRVNPVKLSLASWLDDFIQQYTEAAGVPPDACARYGLDGIEACVDPDQLHQVVNNLCQNAFRHSPPYTGTPLVKFQAGREPDERRPYLDVIDWGTGIPLEIADSIFDPFFTTTPKGTGLGLYIAAELCEGNGAKLAYYPGDGGVGCRFRITFARAEECADLGVS